MAWKLFGRFDAARFLVRIAHGAISLNGIPHMGAETLPAHDKSPSHSVVFEAGR